MTLQDLNCFMEVAGTLNYTRAGEKLFISQPVVSRHISTLEEELGFALFDRAVKRTVVLTAQGEMLFECLKRCREDYGNTLKDIEQILGKTPLYFYIPEDTTIPYEICGRFDRIRLQYANAVTTFRSAPQGKFKEVMDDGGFLICQKNALPDAYPVRAFALSSEKEQYYLLCSRRHPAVRDLKEGEEPAPERFAGSPLFLHRDISPEYCAMMESYAHKMTGVRPTALRLDTTDTIMAYLFSDLGYTIVHSWSSRLKSPDYYAYPLEIGSPVVLAYRRDMHLTETAQGFLKGLKAADH